jgi:hypothetical protein
MCEIQEDKHRKACSGPRCPDYPAMTVRKLWEVSCCFSAIGPQMWRVILRQPCPRVLCSSLRHWEPKLCCGTDATLCPSPRLGCCLWLQWITGDMRRMSLPYPSVDSLDSLHSAAALDVRLRCLFRGWMWGGAFISGYFSCNPDISYANMLLEFSTLISLYIKHTHTHTHTHTHNPDILIMIHMHNLGRSRLD